MRSRIQVPAQTLTWAHPTRNPESRLYGRGHGFLIRLALANACRGVKALRMAWALPSPSHVHGYSVKISEFNSLIIKLINIFIILNRILYLYIHSLIHSNIHVFTYASRKNKIVHNLCDIWIISSVSYIKISQQDIKEAKQRNSFWIDGKDMNIRYLSTFDVHKQINQNWKEMQLFSILCSNTYE